MAISDNYVPVKQIGNGVTVNFSANWNILAASFIRVYLESVSTGVQTLQTLGSDYTLVWSSSGFTVTFLTAPTSANYVVIGRKIAQDQTVPYKTSLGFQGEVEENSFDKITGITQDMQDELDRCLKFPLGSTLVGTLPAPVDDTVLVWDSVSGAVKNGPTTTDISSAAANATLAKDWATKTSGQVASTDYSSKAYAIGGTGIDGAIGSSKAWAISGTSPDGTTNQSAKTYAAQAAISDSNAAASAAAAAASAAEGLYNDVITITFADSPYVPSAAQEGTLFRVDTSGGNVVVNLSTLATYAEDMKFAFCKTTGDANTVTINRGGSDTIDGGTSKVLDTQYVIVVFVGDSATGTWLTAVQNSPVADGSVTNTKLANMAQNRIKGRNDSGSGPPEDLTLSEVLDMVGSAADGDILYRASGSWTRLPKGTASQQLRMNSGGTAPEWASASSAVIVDRAYAEYTTSSDIAPDIPDDDTIPQSSEGTQILSVSITPKTTTNRLRIRTHVWAGADASNPWGIAVFTGASSNAIAVGSNAYGAQGAVCSAEVEIVPGVTSSVTVSVRAGCIGTGNLRVNGYGGVRKFGGAGRAVLVVDEISA